MKLLGKLKKELKKIPLIVVLYRKLRGRFDKHGAGGELYEKGGAPSWYNSELTEDTKKALQGGTPVFLFIPWIVEHGNVLIDRISGNGQDYQIKPLYLTEEFYNNKVRRRVFNFARKKPSLFRKMVIKKLLPYRSKVKGIIVTFDWAPVMRIIVEVCHDLEIPTILIPHESVFADREKYYWDPVAKASVPISDYILGWGGLQKEIFLERGYPSNRFFSVGAPKFDIYKNYHPKISRKQFCELFGLDKDKKIILFASQPLDSQFDIDEARYSQQKAISDLLDYCELYDTQLIVRLPPSKDDILGHDLYQRVSGLQYSAVDDANFYMVPPEEAIYHADMVASVNSTMLFEAVLMSRAPLSVKYIEFDQIWSNIGIPVAIDKGNLFEYAKDLLENNWFPSEEGFAWATSMFTCGEFDGKASERISTFLKNFAIHYENNNGKIERRFPEKKEFDVVATFFLGKSYEEIQLATDGCLSFKTLLDIGSCVSYYEELSAVDLFIEWEEMPEDILTKQRIIQKNLGKKSIFIRR